MHKFIFLLIFPLVLFARDWTVLVYMAADNGLAQFADLDIVEMEEIGSDENITILVQVDKPNIGARRLLIRKETSDELWDLGIIDMCDWQTLYNFLEWGIRNYPAKRYFVILWDHGSGWVFKTNKSFGSDWSSGNELSITNGDFRKAISTTYNNTGKKINLFAFDACLMQQIEVAFEIEDYVKILLAPQTICPLAGFRYDRILQELQSNPGINEVDLSKKVVEITVDNYINTQVVAYSAINLENLDNLAESCDKLLSSFMKGSCNQTMIDVRNDVQTIPVIGDIPTPEDDYVDLGNFIEGLHNTFSNSKTEQLLNIYNNTIIHARYWGEDFSKTTGLTIWFPYEYLEFKQLLNYYTHLIWANSSWLQFLNWFYAKDDIRPTNVVITGSKMGGDNDFHLFWHESYDLAPVTYHLIESNDTLCLFESACEDSNKWNLNGFILTADNSYSGSHSFFSGNASNLQNTIETASSITVDGLGVLSMYLYCNTEEMADSLIIEYGSFKDIHYGWSNGWGERRTILPPGNYKLKISYHTNGSINKGGCYIDDIRICNLKNGRYIRTNYIDTTIYIFNKLRGEYFYAVFPEDKYCNTGNVTNLFKTSVDNFALPYSNPNPFQTSCDIMLDYPDSLQPTVEIFSISGRRIRKFPAREVKDKVVTWDGKDENNRDVGSGIYFILIKDGLFKRIGKIARQR